MKPNSGDKMICINPYGWERDHRWARIKRFFGVDVSVDGPDEGDIVTVLDVYFEDSNRYYSLKEWPEDNYEGYIATEFRPLTTEEEKSEHEKEIDKEISEALTYKPLTV